MLTSSQKNRYNKLIAECEKELSDLNIPFNKNISYSTMKSICKWGDCQYNRKTNSYRVRLVETLLNDDVSDKAIKDTLIHEQLHTAPNCMSHTGYWKAYASRVNARYGYNIKRTTSEEEKAVELRTSSESRKAESPKYKIVCNRCKQESVYIRKSKVVTMLQKNPTSCMCNICGGHNFSVITL